MQTPAVSRQRRPMANFSPISLPPTPGSPLLASSRTSPPVDATPAGNTMSDMAMLLAHFERVRAIEQRRYEQDRANDRADAAARQAADAEARARDALAQTQMMMQMFELASSRKPNDDHSVTFNTPDGGKMLMRDVPTSAKDLAAAKYIWARFGQCQRGPSFLGNRVQGSREKQSTCSVERSAAV